MRLAIFSIAIAAALSTTISLKSEPAERASGAFLIKDVRVFDGEHIRPNLQVYVDHGVIKSVGARVAVDRTVATVDGAGATLLPGLIEAHAHSRTAEDLQQAMRFGVTTVLDMATEDPIQQRALRQAAETRADVADFRSAGVPATAPGAHGTEYGTAITTVAAPADAEPFVAARQRDGADYVKIVLNGVRSAATGIANLDQPTVAALVRATHSRKLQAIAHIETLADARIAIDSGVDGLAHVWRERGPGHDVAADIARHGIFVISTIAVFDGFDSGSGAAIAADRRLAPFISDAARDRLLRPPVPRMRVDVDTELSAAAELRMAGARLLAGTDSGAATPCVHGISLHRELELLVKAGLSPSEALTAATATTANAFRLTDRGMIADGRRADLLLVRGDPTRDITATRDIMHVWRAGIEVDRRSVH